MFQQKIPLLIERDSFIIKTLNNDDDVEKVLRLRHKVFYEELLSKTLDSQLDKDEFDEICDHLVIIDKKTNEIVGTYRLISSTHSDKFYSETEFDLSEIKKLEGIKLELGRACIEKEHRVSGILMMLWKGIFEYVKLLDAMYIFGCSSIKETDSYEIARICNYLKSEGYAEDLLIFPIGNFKVENFDAFIQLVGDQKPKIKIPSLFRSYLKVGVKVHHEPALDEDFQCVDFLTLLKFKDLNQEIKEKLE